MTTCDPRFPAREEIVLPDLLERRANEAPDKTAVLFPQDEWSYHRLAEEAWSAAAGLSELGVGRESSVISWLPNCADALRTWLGANALGATFAPINPAYKGGVLEHAIRMSGAEVMVAHGQLLDRLRGIDTGNVRKIAVIGEAADEPPGLELVGPDALSVPGAERPRLDPPIEPWDLICLILTSGTTGPAKAVRCSYLHHHTVQSLNMPEVGPDDRFYTCLPMFHLSGTGPIYMMIERGGSFALTEGFRTPTFWDDVRRFGITVSYMMGGMASYLFDQPEREDDLDNPLRLAACNPMHPQATEFSRRFGVDLFANYGSTEAPVPLRTEINPENVKTCGKPTTSSYDLRLVDEYDREVPVGEPGELMLRHDRPWSMNLGYKDMPEATLDAWRNGWFHTGDILRRDEDDNYYFVDRRKDALRRRGENISSIEVERELIAHPAVVDAAVVGVSSEEGEEDVKAVVVPKEGATLEAEELLRFVLPRLPYFMVPRYIEVVEELPRTESQKVKKFELREAGVTARTWDREAAGISVRRERLET